jgi:hypothetical protein
MIIRILFLLLISFSAFGQAQNLLGFTRLSEATTVIGSLDEYYIDDKDEGAGLNQVVYSIPWTNLDVGTAYGTIPPSIKYSNTGTNDGNNTNDATITGTFYGTRVELIAQKYPHHGIAAVKVDGASTVTVNGVLVGAVATNVETNVDLYSASANPGQNVVYKAEGLSAGTHTITIRVTGSKNASASDYYVTFDALKINGEDVAPPTSDADYFVAQTGCTGSCSDSNDGLTRLTAKLTIQAAVNLAGPGSIVEVDDGIYRETITVPVSGTSLLPIVIQAADQANVIISGLNTISDGSWSVHSGSIYKTTTLSMPTRATIGFGSAGQANQANDAITNEGIFDYQVFDGGVMQIEARWPKGVQQYTDLHKQTSTGSSTAPASTDTRRHTSDMVSFNQASVVDNALQVSNGFPVAAGGMVGGWINTHGWFIAESRQITSHGGTSGNTLGWSGNIWSDERVRKYYWVTGKLGLLTQQREFHFESGTLYFWAAGGGSPTGVEYKARNWGFVLKDRSYVTIKGFTFKGCEPVMGNTNTSYCTVDNIRATHTNHTVRLTRTYWQGYGTAHLTGIKLIGINNVIKNSELDYGGSQAIWIGAGGVVQNNKIQHYGYDGMWGAGVSFWGEQEVNNIKVLNNEIGYMGRGCIDNGYAFSEQDVSRSTKNNEIGYNNMYGFCSLNQDGGAFYAWGWQNQSGGRYHHNWVHDDAAYPSPVGLWGGAGGDGIMAGFYLDMGSGANEGQAPLTMDHNVFWNIGTSAGWINGDWADIYTHPAFIQTWDGNQATANWDWADRVKKQPNLIYNNTMYGDRHSYDTRQPTVIDINRNNIYNGNTNFNWGSNGGNSANSLTQASNPLFVGGSLSTPATYFQLQSGSPARNIGTGLAVNSSDVDGKDAGAYYFGQTGWTAGYSAVTYTP